MDEDDDIVEDGEIDESNTDHQEHYSIDMDMDMDVSQKLFFQLNKM